MPKVKRVPNFVNRLLQQSFLQQRIVLIKSIKLLTQAIGRHHCAGTTHLRLAENILKNWDVKVDFSHRQPSPVLGPHQGLHVLQDLRRVKLLTLSVVTRCRVESKWQDFATDGQFLWYSGAQVVQQRSGDATDREQMNEIH